MQVIYGEDSVSLFEGQLYLLFDNEYGVRFSRVIRSNGKIVTDMKVLNAVPLIDMNIVGYMLVGEELYDLLYNSFFRITGSSYKSYKVLRTEPIYTNVPILKSDGSIEVGKALISPCKVQYPLMTLKYKNKTYSGKFSPEDNELKSLNIGG